MGCVASVAQGITISVPTFASLAHRSEEHTSELQSQSNLVCRLLLEKKNRHSPRVDEELRRETESMVRGAPVDARAEEWRMMEPGGDGEPQPDPYHSVDDAELRSLLA